MINLLEYNFSKLKSKYFLLLVKWASVLLEVKCFIGKIPRFILTFPPLTHFISFYRELTGK